MGTLSATELARDLVDEWHADMADSSVSLREYLQLAPGEYDRWLHVRELPRDFERRHGQ